MDLTSSERSFPVACCVYDTLLLGLVSKLGPQAKAVRTSGLAATQTSTQMSGLAATRISTRESGLLQDALQVSGLAVTCTSNKGNGLAATHTSTRETSGQRSMVHLTPALNNGYSGERFYPP